MKPHLDSTWWVTSSTEAIVADPDLATLVLRLQLAVNALTVQRRFSVRLGSASATAAGARDHFISFVSTAAFTKEAVEILSGVGNVPGEAARVASLAAKGGAPAELANAIARLCDGSHVASPLMVMLRHQLGAHWDPVLLKEALLAFVMKRSVVWIESAGPSTDEVVHRLPIEVIGSSTFPESSDDGLDHLDPLQAARARMIAALETIGDAGNLIVEYFGFAITGYLEEIGAMAHRKRDSEDTRRTAEAN